MAVIILEEIEIFLMQDDYLLILEGIVLKCRKPTERHKEKSSWIFFRGGGCSTVRIAMMRNFPNDRTTLIVSQLQLSELPAEWWRISYTRWEKFAQSLYLNCPV